MREFVPIIVALIGGLTSAPLWTYLTKQLGIGKTEVDRLRDELKNAEKTIDELKARVAVVEHHHASHFARWISDSHKRVIWVNSKALLSIFAPMGLDRDGVEGKTFDDFVEPKAAHEINQLAARALAQDGTAVSTLIRLHPELPVMHLVKIAAGGRDGELIYEAIAFRMNDPEITFGIGLARQAAQREASIDRLTGGTADHQ